MLRWHRVFILCVACACLLCSAIIPASATGTTEFTVVLDKDTVRPGDTVTCTVNMGSVEDLYGMKLKVTVPDGLTLVQGSGVTNPDLAQVMNAAKTEFVESTGVFLVGTCHYSATSEIQLFQFQCTVDEDAPDTMEFYLDIDPENVFDSKYQNIPFVTQSAIVSLDDTCFHSWTEATAEEDNGHWFDCQLCEMSRIEDHIDENEDGLCDVCGYGTPVKKGNIGIPILVGILLLICAGGAFFYIKIRNRS